MSEGVNAVPGAAESVEAPIPLLAGVTTRALLRHFDGDTYDARPGGHLWHLVEALTGAAGAGDLLRQSLIARLQGSIETAWFDDLDALFASTLAIPRLSSETYDYNYRDQLTSDQLDEALVKDAWYRSRLTDILSGLQQGGTSEGMRLITRGVTGVDADVYESWRFKDSPWTIGRTMEVFAPREIVLSPHKSEVGERERQVLLRVADRLKPSDSFVTVNSGGLNVRALFPVRGASSDSTYFELVKTVTVEADVSKLPAPEYLADELYEGQRVLYEAKTGDTVEARSAAFSTPQEFTRYYSLNPADESQIASVSYTTLDTASGDYNTVNWGVEAAASLTADPDQPGQVTSGWYNSKE